MTLALALNLTLTQLTTIVTLTFIDHPRPPASWGCPKAPLEGSCTPQPQAGLSLGRHLWTGHMLWIGHMLWTGHMSGSVHLACPSMCCELAGWVYAPGHIATLLGP